MSVFSPVTLRNGHQVRLQYVYLFFFVLLHACAALAFLPAFFSWSALLVFAVTYYLSGAIGVTLCFHRLLTHRSFHTSKTLEYVMTFLGTLAWQGSPTKWVGTHRLHHAASDQPEDPHSPRDGFGWSHVFWILHSGHPGQDPRTAALDLARDPFHRFLDRFWWVPQLILGVALYFMGGWSWVLWGVVVRTVILYHATWFVNSAAHTWGYRNFPTHDDSCNNWWVALLSFGEGWHNNHHAQQRSAAHGMRWYEVDLTYLTILLLRKVGLAWKVVPPQRPAAAESLPHAQPEMNS